MGRSKSAILLIIFLTVISFVLTPGFANVLSGPVFPFNDIQGDWAEAAIIEMWAKDVMKGYQDSTFKPKKPVTFLEAVVLLDRLLYGQPLESDIDSLYLHEQYNIPKWAMKYVASAIRHEFLSLDRDEFEKEMQKMSLQQPLTRQEAAKLAIRALELTKQTENKKDTTLPFSDTTQIGEDFKAYIALAYERRIMSGFSDGSFQPINPISRAEIAILLGNIARQLPYINSDEISGIIKSVDQKKAVVTIVSDEGKETVIQLPGQYLIYLNNRFAAIDELAQGNHIRVIPVEPGKLTVVIAQVLVPDNGISTVMEEVNPESVSNDIRQWVETNKTSENYLARVFDKGLYFLAARGEKRKGGYTICITKVLTTTDEKIIHYKVWTKRSDPAPDAFVIQPIWYPLALVRVPLPEKAVGTITFVDQLNQTIAEIKLEPSE